MHTKALVAVMVAALWLTGCASIPAVQYKTVKVYQPVQVPIPSELVVHQPIPAWSAPYTWGSLGQYAINLRHSAEQCDAKLDALRKIARQSPHPSSPSKAPNTVSTTTGGQP